MLSIQISDIKDFMSHLLSKDTFDHFYFIEASIKMGVSYQIQGLILLKENDSLSPAKLFSDFQSNPFPI